jgi:hypothetical protein
MYMSYVWPRASEAFQSLGSKLRSASASIKKAVTGQENAQSADDHAEGQ